MVSRNTRVLGYWQPSIDLTDESYVSHHEIGKEFKTFVSSLGYQITLQSLHSPTEIAEWLQRQSDTLTYHRDCNGAEAKFIVWSNVQPTEIQFENGELLKAEDGAIILVDNLEVLHRTPSPINPKRWLVRSGYIMARREPSALAHELL
jgi:hypothetical protein